MQIYANIYESMHYVKTKDPSTSSGQVGIFTIGFNEAIDTDVEFNWWIIELQ